MGYLEQKTSSQISEEKIAIEPEMLVGGVKVNYYFHCKTQLWLFSHYITMEQEDVVTIGKVIESDVFNRIKTKNVLIDNKISVDFVKRKEELLVFEIKKSSKFDNLHYYQILYYLWYLKNIKGIAKIKGVLTYPLEKKRTEVVLTEEKEREIENILKEINKIISLEKVPKPEYKPYCRHCAYFEFCWV